MYVQKYKKQIIIAVAELILVVLYGTFGHWAHIKNAATDSTVRVLYNSSSILGPEQTKKIRPGKYKVLVSGPRVKSQSTTIVVLPFMSSVVAKDIQSLSDAEILTQAQKTTVSKTEINKIAYYGSSWLFATMSKEGAATDVAAHYSNEKWETFYTSSTGIVNTFDITKMPADLFTVVSKSIGDSGLDYGGD